MAALDDIVARQKQEAARLRTMRATPSAKPKRPDDALLDRADEIREAGARRLEARMQKAMRLGLMSEDGQAILPGD